MEESFETWSRFESRGFNDDSGDREVSEDSNVSNNSASNFYSELNSSVPNSASTTATRKSSISSADKEEPLYDWLQSIHMSEYFEPFTANDITFDMLTYLSKSDLKALVFKVGDRIRIENAIRDLELSGASQWLGSSPTATAMSSSLSSSYENDHEVGRPIDQSQESEIENNTRGLDQDSPYDHSQTQSADTDNEKQTPSTNSITVRFYTLQNKALHLDVNPSQEIVELVLHSAKVPPSERVSINDGFDIFNENDSLKEAIFKNNMREFWINIDPNGIQSSYIAKALPGSGSRGSTPQSATTPTLSESQSMFVTSGGGDDDTITLRSSRRGIERPTSIEVARNISQFFPDSKQELLAKGLRNSVMSNRRLSTVSRDWRSSIRESKRLSTLKLDALQARRDSTQGTVDLEDKLDEELSQSSESDSGLLEQLYHEEMSPTEWLRGKLIGSGSFGSVYLAFNVFSGDILAVKQVQMGGNDQRHKKMLEVLHHEIEMSRTLEHENIVQYRGFKKEGSFLNIFSEYIPGGSLASKLAFHGALKEFTVKHYISQCLAGLSYLHDKGIIHRDIKGANILVDTYDRVKISDFGSSKRENATKNRISMQGTAFWMAPEVARAKEKTTTKADIWSLGCSIVELVTAQHPFPDLQVLQVLYRVGKGETPNIPEHVSPELKEVLGRCFVVEPTERASAQELLKLPFFANEDNS